MANIHELKQAYEDLQDRYANTLAMLLDALDKLDEKPTEVEVEKIVEVEATMDVDLSTPDNIKALEEEYQKALAEFKADKTNKELRRAKTAARRKLDAAILQTTNDGDKQLVCVDCSKKFIFTVEQQQKHTDMGWNSEPKRCEICKKMRNDKSKQVGGRDKLDSKKKNMCYAYQRGECPHGINCKFSHNPKFGGKRSTNGNCHLDKEKKDGSDAAAKNHVNDDEGTESKERKEKSLRKKNGSKGWRNK